MTSTCRRGAWPKSRTRSRRAWARGWRSLPRRSGGRSAPPGRAAFDSMRAKALAEAAETRQPMAVLLCDLDYFAAFNENFGNLVGDRVLRAIGMMFKAHLRNDDVAARFESDQFAAILPGMRAKEAVACAERF